MVIVVCPECRNCVSDSAVACPDCGCPITGDAPPTLPVPPLPLAAPPLVPMDRITSAQRAAAFGLGFFLLAIVAVLFWAARD
jgi:hypothetical protein